MVMTKGGPKFRQSHELFETKPWVQFIECVVAAQHEQVMGPRACLEWFGSVEIPYPQQFARDKAYLEHLGRMKPVTLVDVNLGNRDPGTLVQHRPRFPPAMVWREWLSSKVRSYPLPACVRVACPAALCQRAYVCVCFTRVCVLCDGKSIGARGPGPPPTRTTCRACFLCVFATSNWKNYRSTMAETRFR